MTDHGNLTGLFLREFPSDDADAMMKARPRMFASRSEAARYAAGIRWQNNRGGEVGIADRQTAPDAAKAVRACTEAIEKTLNGVDEYAYQARKDNDVRERYIANDYETINGFLRDSKGVLVEDYEPAQAMDRMFKRAGVGIESESEVYRGMALDRKFRDDYLEKFAVGQEFTDHGYMSVSADSDIAWNDTFTGGPRHRNTMEVFMRIRLPEKTVVLGGDTTEAELILGRGTRFRVTKSELKTTGVLKGGLLIEVEVMK
jgi:hypothetical protein